MLHWSKWSYNSVCFLVIGTICCYQTICTLVMFLKSGASILGGWGSRPPDFGQRGREILYLIMHRKYVRKWRLLRRNRIICLEVAVNGQFLPGKSIFFKLPEKIEFFLNLPGKIELLLTRIHDPPDVKPD